MRVFFFSSMSILLYLSSFFLDAVYADTVSNDSAHYSPIQVTPHCKQIKIDMSQAKIIKPSPFGHPLSCGDPRFIPVGIEQHDIPSSRSTVNRKWITDITHTGSVFHASNMHYYLPGLKFTDQVNAVDLICAPYIIDTSTWKPAPC
jgi:hypothetical protein